jgi:hypothetical protein
MREHEKRISGKLLGTVTSSVPPPTLDETKIASAPIRVMPLVMLPTTTIEENTHMR